MGSRGSALDNAGCESVMATLKTEYVNRRSFRSRDQARAGLFAWIQGWYNPRRRHSSLGYRSPDSFERAHASAGDAAAPGTAPAETPSERPPPLPPPELGQAFDLTPAPPARTTTTITPTSRTVDHRESGHLSTEVR